MGTEEKKMLHTCHSCHILPPPHSGNGVPPWPTQRQHAAEMLRMHMTGGLKSGRGWPFSGSPRFRHAKAVSAFAAHSSAYSRLAGRVNGMGGGQGGRGAIILINIYRSILLDKKKIIKRGGKLNSLRTGLARASSLRAPAVRVPCLCEPVGRMLHSRNIPSVKR